MKKILILTTISGFLDKFEKENVKILQELGYEVHYAANMYRQNYLYEEAEIRQMGVVLHHIEVEKSPRKLEQNRKALKQTVDLIKSEGITVIHCHTPIGGVIGRLAGEYCRKKNIPMRVIYTAHGFHFYKGGPMASGLFYRFVEGRLARHTDVLITINREDFEAASRFHLRKGGRVYQIPGVGLDLEHFKIVTKEERVKARHQLGIDDDQFFLLSVGEVNKNKNQRIVLEALALLSRNQTDEKFACGICGDGIGMKALKQLRTDLGLEDIVTLYGYCRDVRMYLAAADVFVFPSVREGLGMAALEALAMGIPVIAADNRGTREYMKPGENGWICAWNDAVAFAQAIVNAQELQSLDEEKQRKIRMNCRNSVKRFEKEHTARLMREIYQQL